jgi:hypothetical protein
MQHYPVEQDGQVICLRCGRTGAGLFVQRECRPRPARRWEQAIEDETQRSLEVWLTMKDFLRSCEAHVLHSRGLDADTDAGGAIVEGLWQDFYAFWERFRESWGLPFHPELQATQERGRRLLASFEADHSLDDTAADAPRDGPLEGSSMSEAEEEQSERESWRQVRPRRHDDSDYDALDEQEEEIDLLESGTPEDGDEDLNTEERRDDRR